KLRSWSMGMETSPTTSDLNKSLASTTLVQWPVKRSPFFRITTSARAATAITSTIGIKQNLGLMRASRPKLGLGSIVHGEEIATALGALEDGLALFSAITINRFRSTLASDRVNLWAGP